MTPQILLDALRKGFVSIDVMCMLILDECHRTTGNHPYAKIMKVRISFYYLAYYISVFYGALSFINIQMLLLLRNVLFWLGVLSQSRRQT